MLAREVVSPHTPHLPAPKILLSNSCISITSKLIQNKRLQVYCFGHLQKTGGWGSYWLALSPAEGFATSAAEEAALRIAEGSRQVSSGLTIDCRLSANACLRQRRFLLPLRSGSNPIWHGARAVGINVRCCLPPERPWRP